MPIHASADVDSSARVDPTASVWHLAQIRERAVVGMDSVVGRAAYVGSGVVLGARCKLQNLAQVYEPARLADDVFVGPGAILTNDRHPRAVSLRGDLKTADDWDPVGVICETGASIGAGAICVAPVRIGTWAVVAAGAVVVHDVVDFALVAGVPARRVGWVGRAGWRLTEVGDGWWRCEQTGERYRQEGGRLTECNDQAGHIVLDRP